jgi:hypothetical protein
LLEREAALAAAEEALKALMPAEGTESVSDATVVEAMAKLEESKKRAASVASAAAAAATPRSRSVSAVSADSEVPAVERLAEIAIESAQTDNPLTNPAIAVAGVLEYVNEWRDALVPEETQREAEAGLSSAASDITSTLQSAGTQLHQEASRGAAIAYERVSAKLDGVSAEGMLQGVAQGATSIASGLPSTLTQVATGAAQTYRNLAYTWSQVQ